MGALEIGRRIKEIRKSKKMTQLELSEKVGYVARATITRIEQGKINLSESRIVEIAKALGVTPQEIVGWEEDGNNHYDYYDGYDLTEEEKAKVEDFRGQHSVMYFKTDVLDIDEKTLNILTDAYIRALIKKRELD